MEQVDRVFDFSSINEHVLASVFILVDAIAGRMLVCHSFPLVGYVGAYAASLWLWYLLRNPHGWPYFFLLLRPARPFIDAAFALTLSGIVGACASASAWKRDRLHHPLEGEDHVSRDGREPVLM